MANLSILELGRVREGFTRADALNDARRVAQQAEGFGYKRFWVAEHHNMPAVTTAATSIVISHIAAGTKTLRVGAGGIMLPNHAPYIIAEQFGTLEALYPGRIDLGLGRAPGTDQLTLRALRRDPMSADRFPQDVLELQAYLGPVEEGQRIEAVPGSNSNVPIWILGSSLFGAQMAAAYGFPYGFASHFAPQALDDALAVYRRQFKPSEHQAKPYALIGVNIIAADTDEEAKYLATSQQMSFANLVRGQRKLTQPPIDDINAYWTEAEKLRASHMLAVSIIGGPDKVRTGIQNLLARTEADELMVVSDMYDVDKRIRSFEIIADVMKSINGA
ncbi:LLM class flavin-dependent oxidoreductase [Hyphomonas pacifica]|uniref:LLM class flavin-dependent oxidoreductase n=1 Tax=Hyphomonas pacifica TaxID=1280941 RepID=UPI000DBFC804|nr:LLM class flavin-dependent oxidoreductase [Hyphomonas pacifica]MBR9806166.1 LLM class flavin-dependent oxidoreductase [Alphaproteobacteria bacterium]RAN34719.1 alkane 1-monooxygenase [Hyphomonas pacifica]